MIKKDITYKDFIVSTLASLLFILQIILGFYLLNSISQIEYVAYIGIGLYIISGVIFGMLPTVEFRNKGGVNKGKSYIHTTKLVDSGIYSIVRHPQYLSFILFAMAGMLLFQHWIIVVLGASIIPLVYIDLIKADKEGIRKFGDKYKLYMQKVPRANLIIGIIRVLKQKLEN